MTRNGRALVRDFLAETATRPDIVLADALRSVSRPAMPPPPDEATVPDAPLQLSMAAARLPEERAPLHTSTPPPRSGFRRHKPERDETRQSESGRRAAVASGSTPALPPAPQSKRASLIAIALTALAAAALGASAGSGNLSRVLDAMASRAPAPTPLVSHSAPRPAAAAASPAARATALAPPPQAASKPASDVPVWRLEDLPVASEEVAEKLDERAPSVRRRHRR